MDEVIVENFVPSDKILSYDELDDIVSDFFNGYCVI